MSLELQDSMSLVATLLVIVGVQSVSIGKLWKMGLLLIFLASLSWIVHPDPQYRINIIGTVQRYRIRELTRRIEAREFKTLALLDERDNFVLTRGEEQRVKKLRAEIDEMFAEASSIRALARVQEPNQDEMKAEVAMYEQMLLRTDALYLEIKQKLGMQ